MLRILVLQARGLLERIVILSPILTCTYRRGQRVETTSLLHLAKVMRHGSIHHHHTSARLKHLLEMVLHPLHSHHVSTGSDTYTVF
jgi:hypothetical protein